MFFLILSRTHTSACLLPYFLRPHLLILIINSLLFQFLHLLFLFCFLITVLFSFLRTLTSLHDILHHFTPTLTPLLDAPVCREPHMAYHGAARYEKMSFPCHVDAHPRPFTYRWTFNNSAESVEIPQVRKWG